MDYITAMFVSRVDRNLLCGICAGVFKKPLVTQCGHTYCEECLEHWLSAASHGDKTCPECRREVSLCGTAPVLALRGVIDGLSVECENSANGCTMVLKLGDLENHLKNCGYTLVECCGCDGMILQSEVCEHQGKCGKLNNPSLFEGHLNTGIATLQYELSQTKKSLQISEETVRRLQRSLREVRVRSRIRSSQSNQLNEDSDPAWDPDYGYGYSPRSVVQLSSFISRFLIDRPRYVDPERIFTCLKRCYDYYHNCAAFWPDVHMLLATAAASDWFTEPQRGKLISWLKSLAREKLLN